MNYADQNCTVIASKVNQKAKEMNYKQAEQSFGVGISSSTSVLGGARASTFHDVVGSPINSGSIKVECAEIAPKLGAINQLLNELEGRLEPVLSAPSPYEAPPEPRGISDMQRYLNGINNDLDSVCSRIRVLIDRVTL